MATEVGAVEFDLTSRTADAQRFRAGRHGLTHLMRPHESGFVLDVELTREREHAVARDFVTERDNCKQVGPQWQLVMGEQRAGGDREIAAARLAAPARPVRRPWAGIADHAAAARADRLTIGLRPAQAQEHVHHAAIRHAHDLRRAERACRRGKQEMLRHADLPHEIRAPLVPEGGREYKANHRGGISPVAPAT